VPFKKGHTPWNKNKIGAMPKPWNKGLVGVMKVNETSFKKGHTPWNKKYEKTVKFCKNCGKETVGTTAPRGKTKGDFCSRSCKNLGKYNPAWRESGIKKVDWNKYKGGYRGLHARVQKMLGELDTCEMCGKSELRGKKIHWANKSGEYKEEPNDWIRLCAKCHKSYDRGYKCLFVI